MGIKFAVMVEKIPMVSSSVKVQLVIKTLVVNPAMIKEMSIVPARIQTVIIPSKTIIVPCMIVKLVGNRAVNRLTKI